MPIPAKWLLGGVLAAGLIACGGCVAETASPWVIDEDFSAGMGNWWVEGGERVSVEDGRLLVQADNPDVPGGSVCTVWCRTPHPADFELEFDVGVVRSSLDANNVNLFLGYSDPSGTPLHETRGTRATAAYKLYHELNGHILTFLNDFRGEGGKHADGSTKARIRIRRCPGFELLAETYAGRCRAGETYHVKVTKRGGTIVFYVDGREMLRAKDPTPPGAGLLGLRTYRTVLWWDNIRLRNR